MSFDAERAVQIVAALPVPVIRGVFAALRDAPETGLWEKAMPSVGLTVAEFCVGYVLRPGKRTAGKPGAPT